MKYNRGDFVYDKNSMEICGVIQNGQYVILKQGSLKDSSVIRAKSEGENEDSTIMPEISLPNITTYF